MAKVISSRHAQNGSRAGRPPLGSRGSCSEVLALFFRTALAQRGFGPPLSKENATHPITHKPRFVSPNRSDPAASLDFLWACIHIPRIWQGRDQRIPQVGSGGS